MPTKKTALRLFPALAAALVLLAGCGGAPADESDAPEEEAPVPFPAAAYQLAAGGAGTALYSGEEVVFVFEDKLYRANGAQAELLFEGAVCVAGANSDGLLFMAQSVNVPNDYEGPPVRDLALYVPSTPEVGYILRDVAAAMQTAPGGEAVVYAVRSGEEQQFLLKTLAPATRAIQMLFYDDGVAGGTLPGALATDVVLAPAEGGGVLATLFYPAAGGGLYERTLLFGPSGALVADSEGTAAPQPQDAAIAGTLAFDASWEAFSAEYNGTTVRAVRDENGLVAFTADGAGPALLPATVAGHFLLVDTGGDEGLWVVDFGRSPAAVVATGSATDKTPAEQAA